MNDSYTDFPKKKRRTRTTGQWIITFADMITLLFIFFIYITLVNNIPGVDFEELVTDLTESDRIVTIRAKLEFPTEYLVSVPFLVRGNAKFGNDHNLEDNLILIPAGQEEGTFDFELYDNVLHQRDKKLEIIMGGPVSNARPNEITTQTYQIADNDPTPQVAWETDEIEVLETAGAVSFQAKLNNRSGLPVEIYYSVDSAAAPGLEHNLENGRLRILPGETEITKTFRLKTNPKWEPTKTLVVTMDSASDAIIVHPQTMLIHVLDSLNIKDCRAIGNYMEAYPDVFANFQLRADPQRCIISLPQEFLFQTLSADLSSKAEQLLGPLFARIRETYPDDLVIIEGHSDPAPIFKNDPLRTKCKARFCNNWELSSARATSMALFMIKQVGFDPTNLSVSGFADTRPKVPYTELTGEIYEAAKEANRRVEIILIDPTPEIQATQLLYGKQLQAL